MTNFKRRFLLFITDCCLGNSLFFFFRIFFLLKNISALQQPDDNQDQGDDEQDMNQAAKRVGTDESQQPKNQQDCNYCPHMIL